MPDKNIHIKAGIIGAAGYTGGELIRILMQHPNASIVFAQSNSHADQPVYIVHQDLLGSTNLHFSKSPNFDIDVLFICSGHGGTEKFLNEYKPPATVRIVDLSNDYRLQKNKAPQHRSFVYGLPELNREIIKTARNIANPGCFATAIQLGLLPLAQAGLLSDVYTTGITGSTGAGQSLTATGHFSWRANNIQAYKTLQHQHLQEILQSVHQLQEDYPTDVEEGGPSIHFVPWRGDFTRGIFVSSTISTTLSIEELHAMYLSFYETHPFTLISHQDIFLKQVVNTNKCVIQLEKSGNMLVVHSAIDNLLKGASGQAVQNMNLMFGLEEKAGLELKAGLF